MPYNFKYLAVVVAAATSREDLYSALLVYPSSTCYRLNYMLLELREVLSPDTVLIWDDFKSISATFFELRFSDKSIVEPAAARDWLFAVASAYPSFDFPPDF